MSRAIALKSLSKTYTQRNGSVFKAIDNLNLSVESGHIFGFLGPNGAGKTTTIKMMCNLISPTTGTITLNGYAIHTHRVQAMNQIGAVLEGARNIYWQLSAWQNLRYFGQLKGQWGSILDKRSESLLKELDLWHVKNEPLSNFSRGMQQKVAIACSLIANPSIILLDEPTLGLDVQSARAIKQWLAHLAKHERKTIVLTTHQLDIAESVCDQVAIIHNGSLIAHSSMQELLHHNSKNFYQITVESNITEHAHLFNTMTLTYNNGQSIIYGSVNSQKELHEMLALLHKLNVPLLSVTPMRENLEEVFMRLLQTHTSSKNI